MADETRVLANYAAQFSYDQIPDRVRARAIDNIIDQLGCQIGCSNLPWARQVRDVYSRSGGTPEATVVNYGERLPLAVAAFINSTFGHSFEYDDVNPTSLGHPGAELVAAFLAVAERQQASGRDFLSAFVAAYEVRGRIGWSVSPDLVVHGGPHPSSTCGPFGVAVGVAKLLGLGADGIRHAMGIAAGTSGGLMQYDHGGGSVKRIVCAHAAAGGIRAAELAHAGVTGPEGILEGTRGLLRIYGTEFRPERLVADFGRLWTLENVLFKAYCCCAVIHPAIDGVRKMLAAGVHASDIESIKVGYPTRAYDHAAITNPHDILGMQFSTAYSLALTILRGGNTPKEYTEDALADPDIRALASKIHVHEEAALGVKHEGFVARTTLRTLSGQLHEQLITAAKGSPGAPMSSDEIDSKFIDQAAKVLEIQHCKDLLSKLRNLDSLEDMATLAASLKNSKA